MLEGISEFIPDTDIWSYIEKNRLHCVMLDMASLGIDALEVAKRLRQQSAEVSIILITGLPFLDRVLEAARENTYYYLIKPFKFEQAQCVMARARNELALKEKCKQQRIQITRLQEENRSLCERLHQLAPEKSRPLGTAMDKNRIQRVAQMKALDSYTQQMEKKE